MAAAVDQKRFAGREAALLAGKEVDGARGLVHVAHSAHGVLFARFLDKLKTSEAASWKNEGAAASHRVDLLLFHAGAPKNVRNDDSWAAISRRCLAATVFTLTHLIELTRTCFSASS